MAYAKLVCIRDVFAEISFYKFYMRIEYRGNKVRSVNLFLKRCFEFVGSLIGVFFLSPFFIIIAILIKVTSKGPVFFVQERLGKDGKVFKIIKFRTMVVNAEYLGDGLRVKEGSDPRITKVGRMLRKMSLDELPQLFNVLNGSMGWVGPWPPVTYYPYAGYLAYPESRAKKQFQVCPGITGLAQVRVRNSAINGLKEYVLIMEYVDKFNEKFS